MPDGRICWSGRYKETASCIKAGIGGFSRTMWDLIKPIFSNRNTIKPNNSRSIGYVCDGDCLSNQRRLSTYFCVSQLVSCVLLVVWLQSHTTRHCFMLPVSQIKISSTWLENIQWCNLYRCRNAAVPPDMKINQRMCRKYNQENFILATGLTNVSDIF